MAWIYFPESVESVSHLSLGCGRSATSKLSRTARPFYKPESRTADCVTPRFGMILRPLTPPLGLERWISSLGDSLASISALQARERDWREGEAAFFSRSSGLLARFDHRSSSWKTPQQSLDGGEMRWSEPLPRWGMTRGGGFYRLSMWERRTKGTGGGAWPTPTATDSKNRDYYGSGTVALTGLVRLYPTPQARDWKDRLSPKQHGGYSPSLPVLVSLNGLRGYLNPQLREVIMGFPIGWSGLNVQETQWYQCARKERSKG